MKKYIVFLILAVIIVLLVLTLVSGMKLFSLGKNVRLITTPTTTFHSGAVILDAIHTKGKLETVDMVIANDQDVSKKWGVEVVGEVACYEKITYLGYYTVTAGVDLQRITPADILITNDAIPSQANVTITVPGAEILHVELDQERSRMIHQDVAILSQVCGTKLPDMVLEAQGKIYDYARNAALNKDIQGMAQEQAGLELQQLLYNLGFTKVNIGYHVNDIEP